MRISNRSWPHPVLAPFRDDVLPNAFSFTLGLSSDRQNYYLKIAIELAHDDLRGMVSEGHAIACVHVECRRNFYRVMWPIVDLRKDLVIPATELRGSVEVFCCVLAARDVTSYRIQGQHPDYGQASFRIREGDFLAVTDMMHFDAFLDFDPLKKLSSILTIRESDNDDEGPMKVILGEPKIVAELSRADYRRYVDLKRDTTLLPLLASQVVVPALMEAVARIKSMAPASEGYEENMELRWFRSITAKIKERKINVWHEDTQAARVVQNLLDLPLQRSLTGLLLLAADDEEEA